MYTGDLRLFHHGEEHYRAKINSAVIRENEVVIDFFGADEGSRFTGNCRLSRQNGENHFNGSGEFKYEDSEASAFSVELTLELDGTFASLSGTWLDAGESEPYELDVFLEKRQ